MSFLPSRRMVLGAAAAFATGNAAQTMPAHAQQDTPDPTLGRTLLFDENFAVLDPAIWHAGPKATTREPGFYGRRSSGDGEG